MYFGRPLPRCLLPVGVLLTLLGTASRPVAAKDTWIEARSPHFTVISNAGDKEARRIADQFEQFRGVFHSAFPALRLDLGCPLIIFALKNENSLKGLLPGYWEVQGGAHPAGVYVSGEDRHFVALRTNTEGALPYEIVYHEYAHAILNLNFRYLPVWLSEGLAEYFGNSRIRDQEVDIGVPSSYRLETLRQNRMIPIEDLLSADHTSPYYNERNRVSVFYAESWAMVHYLLLDPEARNQQLLAHFIRAWEASGDQVEAARETFGDLKKFSQTMEAYARKQQFMVGTLKTAVRGDPKSLMSREMPPAELAAYRALFYIHTKRPAEAEAAVQEALQQNPQLSVAYEAQGLEAYAQNQFAAAGRSFARAVALGEASFSAYYFDAMSELRAGVETEADQEHVIASFEKAIAMNALFAPAFANLASLYSMRPATSAKAIQLAGKAVELDPGNLRYAINFAHVLLNAGKVDEAKELAVRIRRAAWIPADKADADQLFRNVTDYEEQSRQAAQRARLAEEAQAANNTRAVGGTAPATAAAAPRPAGRAPAAAPPKDRRSQYMVEGLIAEAECNSNSSGRVTLSVNHSTMRFVYSSLAGLSLVEGLTEDTGHAPACANWKGRRARLFFFQTKDKPYAGELQTIQFF